MITIKPDIKVGSGADLLLIAGPCQIESLEHCLKIATHLTTLQKSYPVNFVFKSSFDKANRTSLHSKRGPGIEEGLKILAQVKQETKLPIVVDVHSPEQSELAAEVADIIQTPAFLCRQTDLLIAAGKTNKVVNIKKGQFLHPEDMRFAAEKVSSTGNNNILLCERGSCFGYRELIVDMRSFLIMKDLGYPVIFDATHSVQMMGSQGGASGGSRKYVRKLVHAAVAVGVDGLFIECHDKPDNAPSDGPSMLPLAELEELVDSSCKIREAC